MDELEAISALRALGEPTRWKVMRLLASKQHGMAAGEIAEALQVRQNTLSSHIATLTRCGLIDGHRQGRQIVYAADFRKRPQTCFPCSGQSWRCFGKRCCQASQEVNDEFLCSSGIRLING